VARRCTLGQCWESRGGGGGGGGGSALDEVILEKSMNALRMLLRIDATSSRMSTIRTIVRRRAAREPDDGARPGWLLIGFRLPLCPGRLTPEV
jgi:hypothetical protein